MVHRDRFSRLINAVGMLFSEQSITDQKISSFVYLGQYGIPKPWYFMFQPSYWCSNKRKNSIAGMLPSSNDAGLFRFL